VPAELAVETEHETPGPELLGEEAARELLGRDAPQVLVEGQRDGPGDPRPAEQLEAMLEARQRSRRAAAEKGPPMIPKGDDGRHGAESARMRDVLSKDRLVTEVHAVEHAHADDGPLPRGIRQPVPLEVDDHSYRAASRRAASVGRPRL